MTTAAMARSKIAILTILRLLCPSTRLFAQTSCGGDRDDNGRIRIDELIAAVDFALGRKALRPA